MYKSVFKNPIWIGCTILFLGHQVLQKGFHIPLPYIDSYADPTLGIISFLGVLLAERKFILKKNYQFSLLETIIITVFLSILMEEGFPIWSNQFTHDYMDYIFYSLGGVIFHLFINKWWYSRFVLKFSIIYLLTTL